MTEFVNELLREEWAKQEIRDEAAAARFFEQEVEVSRRMFEPNYEHRDGVWWHDAPLPRRLHFCSPWTTGWVALSPVYRCACGAISRDGHHWMERNSRHARQ